MQSNRKMPSDQRIVSSPEKTQWGYIERATHYAQVELLNGVLSVAAGESERVGSERVWSRGDCLVLWRQRRWRQRPDSDSCARAGRWRCCPVGGSDGSRTRERLQPDPLRVRMELFAYRLDRWKHCLGQVTLALRIVCNVYRVGVERTTVTSEYVPDVRCGSLVEGLLKSRVCAASGPPLKGVPKHSASANSVGSE